MFKIKKIILGLFLSILSQSIFSQVEILLPLIKPSGNFGYVFKPTIGFELRYNPKDFDEQFHYGVTGGIFFLKSRRDVYYDYAVEGSTLYPSPSVYSHFYSLMVGIFTEYRILDNDISPFVGIDANIHGTHFLISDVANTGSTEEGSLYVGIQPRIGLLYKFSDKFIFTVGFGKSMSMDKDYMVFSYWKTYVGVRYCFQ